MDIAFKKGAVCYAGGYQWFSRSGVKGILFNHYLHQRQLDELVTAEDFQLNTIKQGDCIESSCADTEQKYIDSVGVFDLFGFKPTRRHRGFSKASYNNLTVFNDGYCYSLHETPRKLTYNQLMAIGKLKRLMNEREDGLSGHFIGLDKAIHPCDLDKIVFHSDNILEFNTDITEGEEEDTKASKSYNLLKSMDIYYDEDLKLWYKKEFL